MSEVKLPTDRKLGEEVWRDADIDKAIKDYPTRKYETIVEDFAQRGLYSALLELRESRAALAAKDAENKRLTSELTDQEQANQGLRLNIERLDDTIRGMSEKYDRMEAELAALKAGERELLDGVVTSEFLIFYQDTNDLHASTPIAETWGRFLATRQKVGKS